MTNLSYELCQLPTDDVENISNFDLFCRLMAEEVLPTGNSEVFPVKHLPVKNKRFKKQSTLGFYDQETDTIFVRTGASNRGYIIAHEMAHRFMRSSERVTVSGLSHEVEEVVADMVAVRLCLQYKLRFDPSLVHRRISSLGKCRGINLVKYDYSILASQILFNPLINWVIDYTLHGINSLIETDSSV